MAKIQPKQIDLYTDPSFIMNSDLLIPSQKATKEFVKGYVDDRLGNTTHYELLTAGSAVYNVNHTLNTSFVITDLYIAGTDGNGNFTLSEKIYGNIKVISDSIVQVRYNTITSTDTVLIIMAANSSANTSGAASGIINLTHADALSLMGTSLLNTGSFYRISDFRTKHQITHTTDIVTGSIEPLLLLANSASSFDVKAYSTIHINDYIEYNINDVLCEDGSTARTGFIKKRVDTVNRLSTPYDFRVVKFRRWELNTNIIAYNSTSSYSIKDVVYNSNAVYVALENNITGAFNASKWGKAFSTNGYYGLYLIANNNTPIELGNITLTATSNYQDYLTFGSNCFNIQIETIGLLFNNTFGDNCENINIKKSSDNNIIDNDSYQIDIGYAVDNNIISGGCTNIKLKDGCSRMVMDACVNVKAYEAFNTVLCNSSSNINIDKGSSYITIGDSSYDIKIGTSTSNILHGKNSYSLNYGNQISNVILLGSSGENYFADYCGSITGSNVYNIRCEEGCTNITLGNDTYQIKFGVQCKFITLVGGTTFLYFADFVKNKTFNNVVSGIKLLLSDTTTKTYNISGTNNIVVDMKSPDNEMWYKTIDNSGNITVQKLI